MLVQGLIPPHSLRLRAKGGLDKPIFPRKGHSRVGHHPSNLVQNCMACSHYYELMEAYAYGGWILIRTVKIVRMLLTWLCRI